MVCKIGLTIFFIVEAVALALFVIGTPLPIFRNKTEGSDGNTGCLTMWGYKTKCSDSKYDLKVGEIFDDSKCDTRKDLFQASEALSIVSIVVFAACIVMVLLMCCCSCVACICRIILMILIVVGILTGAATFACMAYIYNNNYEKLQDAIDGNETKVFILEDINSEGAAKESNSAAALLSDSTSGRGHLTSGSFPMFAEGDNTTDDNTTTTPAESSSSTTTTTTTTSEPVNVNGFCDALKDSFNYGSGFIMIVVAWALHTVNIAFALLPC